MSDNGWIGVDLDGTLAHYDGWRGIEHIGDPIPLMVDRVKGWLAEGRDVRIFTARVWEGGRGSADEVTRQREYIEKWCLTHLGAILPITNEKDFSMIQLWDDRCIQVLTNRGLVVTADGVHGDE